MLDSTMDDLTKHRKDRLRALIDGKPFLGNQSAFAQKVGRSKGYITQLLDPEVAFGERAAMKLASTLRKDERYFERQDAGSEGAPIPHAERDLVAEAMEVLALACTSLDKRTRLSIAPLFSSLATEPEDLKAIIQTVKKLLPDQNLARESHPPKSTSTTIGGLGKLEDLKTDGQGIRVQTPQGKR